MGITTAGLREVAKKIVGASAGAAFDYLALGDDNTAFAVGQTALGNEITGNGLARAQDASPSESSAVATIDYTWTASGSETIREVGSFNASSSGTMLHREVLGTARSMTNGSTYKYTLNVTVS